jgi:hypothetical protein
MERKIIGIMILYAIGVLMGLIAVIMFYFGEPGEFETEPLLGIGLLFVSIAGLRSIKK